MLNPGNDVLVFKYKTLQLVPQLVPLGKVTFILGVNELKGLF